MAKLHNEVHINAPLEKVWSVIADLESVRYTNPLVREVRIISPNRDGTGAARHCDFTDGSFVEEKITGYDPQKSISFEAYKHEWPLTHMRWTTRMVSKGNGTFVTVDTDYGPKFGIVGAIMNALLMRRKFYRIIDDAMVTLKNYIEAMFFTP